MGKKKKLGSDMMDALLLFGVIVFAGAIALPVFFYMQRAQNIGDTLTQERISSFVSETIVAPEYNTGDILAGTVSGGIDVGPRSTRYSNTGHAIITVNLQNIERLGASDFEQIGSTPWSLMNTVDGNLAVPSVISIVFDNRNVVNGFLGRASTQSLAGNPNILIDMIKKNDPVIERFFNNPTVKDSFDNELVMQALAQSSLFANLLNSRTGEYFIRNPQLARQLVAGNRAMAPLLNNGALRKILLNNSATAEAAQEFYK